MSEPEYEVLKQTSLAGISTVFYERFAINLPDMAYAEEKYDVVDNLPELPDLTTEEQQHADEKLAEIRRSLKEKLSMKN